MKKYYIVVTILVLLLSGCASIEEDTRYIDKNINFLVKNLNVDIDKARHIEEKLESIGCSQIVSRDSIDFDSCISIAFTDSNNVKYFMTVSFDGYLGYIRDDDGNVLYYELDD
jgi:hypothetical protein